MGDPCGMVSIAEKSNRSSQILRELRYGTTSTPPRQAAMAEEDFVDYEEDDQQVGAVSSSKDTNKYVPSHAQVAAAFAFSVVRNDDGTRNSTAEN